MSLRLHAVRQAGFTLIEIMVSIMIFTVVGGAMMGILLLATDLYRRGEAGRSANDEAVAVLAALDADLSRIVPPHDGGFFFSTVWDADNAGGPDANGNTLVAFKTAARDRSTITDTGQGARTIVAWWVDRFDNLRRAELAETPTDNDPATDEDFNTLNAMFATQAIEDAWPIVTSQCLHFGAWLSLGKDPRTSSLDWRSLSAQVDVPVAGTDYHCGGKGTDLFPESMRLTIALTGGGRFAPTGFVVSDSGTDIRIAGLKGIPTIPGSMVRVGDEWVGYSGYTNGTLLCTTYTDPLVGRGQRRSTSSTHPVKTPVRLAQTYSLVRDLPR